jgi:hypothetical protein
VTRERIRQIEAKALRKLKHPSRSRKLRSFLDNWAIVSGIAPFYSANLYYSADSSKPPLATGDLVLELCGKRFGADAEKRRGEASRDPGLRSKSKKDAKLIAAFHRTGFFDAAYCLANNPDVAANGIGPALHFTQRGWKEGRKPGPRFDPVHIELGSFRQNPVSHTASAIKFSLDVGIPATTRIFLERALSGFWHLLRLSIWRQ